MKNGYMMHKYARREGYHKDINLAERIRIMRGFGTMQLLELTRDEIRRARKLGLIE